MPTRPLLAIRDSDSPDQFPSTALVPYLSDQYLKMGSTNSVTYQVNGIEGSRTVTFHWQASSLTSCGFFDFYVVFQESLPNEVTYYYNIIEPCNGDLGLVGASSPYGKFTEPSCFCPYSCIPGRSSSADFLPNV